MEPRSKWISLALALVAASGFALAVQTAWWKVAEVTVGPFGSRHCFGGECRESGLSWIGGSDLWMRAAVASRAAGYIAMFALVLLAGAVAAKRIPVLVARMSIVAILTALVSGIYFFAAFPGLKEASLGLGGLFFTAATIAGMAAAIIVARAQPAPR
jgi:hypothetical protein